MPAENEIILPRTGLPPLRFTGNLIAEASGERDRAGNAASRWHAITIYRTTSGKYVVHIEYRTNWQNELFHDQAEIMTSSKEVSSTLTEYDPTRDVVGYPPSEHYQDKQDRLMKDIESRYLAQVSAILSSSREFAEEVA